MPLTAAERQKRYRQKLKSTDPEKFQEQKKKNSERTLRQYKNKTANYSEEQKEELRKKWREDRKKKEGAPLISQQTASKKSNQNITHTQIFKKIQRNVEQKFRNEIIQLQRKLTVTMKGFTNLQRKVQRQQEEIESMNKKYENVMSKLEAKINANAKDKQETENFIYYYKDSTASHETPIKRVTEFINQTIPNIATPQKEEIKKKLIEHDLLQKSFKNQYKNSNQTDKDVLKKIVNSDIMKKYKKATKFKVTLGLQNSSYKKLEENQKKRIQLQKQIAAFYKRDDVSRATAGKKEYKTHKKVKFQKRYLLDMLKNLHKKYVEEVGTVSFSTFKKYRPFYVLSPNIKDCESCACLKHSNMQFMIDKLKSLGLLKSNILNDVVSEFVCDFKVKRCMYGDCPDCSERHIDDCDIDSQTQVKWFKWTLKEYEYGKEGNVKKSKKFMKTENEGTLKDLLKTFNKEMKTFKKHIFNFYYQYKQYKQCAENLQEHETLIHIDFSENYVCKYYQEVQAKHFVKDQITLHTGVLYLKNKKPISFCSISPDNTHTPESIWGHLDPVLNYVKNENPNISTVHFFSDGPATQYRQKKNFFLFSQNIYDYGFTNSSWSYFEAAHGKGAADGVGGAIKRTLDMKTAQGLDIPDAKTAYDVLSSTETKIRIFYVPSENIKPLDPLIVENLTPISGTMKIHQVITRGKYKISYRDLSCFCKDICDPCACHSPKYHDFSTSNKINQSKRNRKRNICCVNNGNTAQISLKKAKRHRNQSISSSEDDTDIEIKYAESDADDEFLSDISMTSDLVHADENVPDDSLDKNSGIIPKRVDPNKKIHILSTKIINNPLQSSNSSKSQVKDGDRDIMKNREDIEEQCFMIMDSINNENYNDMADICKMNKDEKEITGIIDSCKLKKNDEENNEKFLSDISIISDLVHAAENVPDDSLVKNSGIIPKRVDPNKKIHILSTKIINNPLQSSNSSKSQVKDGDRDIMKNREDIEEQCFMIMDSINNENYNDMADICKMNKDEKEITGIIDSCELKKNDEENGTNKDKKKISETMDVCKINKGEVKWTDNVDGYTKKKKTETTTGCKMKKNEEVNTETVDDFGTSENSLKEILQVDSSVIVRYYERKKWKYYVGFITDVINKNNETFYKTRFLKTIKNPSLKFLVTKKDDIDIVPSVSVVKRIELIPLEQGKRYIIKDDFDYVYFSDF